MKQENNTYWIESHCGCINNVYKNLEIALKHFNENAKNMMGVNPKKPYEQIIEGHTIYGFYCNAKDNRGEYIKGETFFLMPLKAFLTVKPYYTGFPENDGHDNGETELTDILLAIQYFIDNPDKDFVNEDDLENIIMHNEGMWER